MVHIGLTGSIGSGKSTVANYLRRKGYPVVDADKIVHDLYQSISFKEEFKIRFGEEFLDQNGSIDRKKLANSVFCDENLRERLNSLVHPLVLSSLLSKSEDSDNKWTFYDVPLLFETGMDRHMDSTVVVVTKEELLKKRVQLRDHRSPNEIEAILKNQMSQKEKMMKSDFIIYNNSTVEELFQEVDKTLCGLDVFFKK